jgi:hypothetical protein
MTQPKLRRVLALTALLSALSMLPAQAMGSPAQVHERFGLSARLERLEQLAWNFMLGLFEKKGSNINPDGLAVQTSVDGGH